MRPVVVGMGPAGLFAALELAEAGLRPLVIERGAPVDERMADIERFHRTRVLDTASNVQFGEGGAGTFSDGKLTTGKNSPQIAQVLETFVAAARRVRFSGRQSHTSAPTYWAASSNAFASASSPVVARCVSIRSSWECASMRADCCVASHSNTMASRARSRRHASSSHAGIPREIRSPCSRGSISN